MNKLLILFPGNEVMAEKICVALKIEKAEIMAHNFPNGESCVRLFTDVTDNDVIIVATLHRRDPKNSGLFTFNPHGIGANSIVNAISK
jgi:ribose-phosphate pyrophosphokinase